MGQIAHAIDSIQINTECHTVQGCKEEVSEVSAQTITDLCVL